MTLDALKYVLQDRLEEIENDLDNDTNPGGWSKEACRAVERELEAHSRTIREVLEALNENAKS